jgi:hypothetical protein
MGRKSNCNKTVTSGHVTLTNIHLFRGNVVPKGRSTAVIAVILFINLMAVPIARANELAMQVSGPAEFHHLLCNETPNLPSSSIDPANQSLRTAPDMDALQPITLDFRPAQPSGKVDIDPSQRVPEPWSLSLFGSGLLMLGLALRARNAQSRQPPVLVAGRQVAFADFKS